MTTHDTDQYDRPKRWDKPAMSVHYRRRSRVRPTYVAGLVLVVVLAVLSVVWFLVPALGGGWR